MGAPEPTRGMGEPARDMGAPEPAHGMGEPEPRNAKEGLVTHFFARGKQMERSICVLCSNAREEEHIVSTLGIMLTRQLQLTLTSVGLQPFQGRELTFPYH